MRTLTLLVHLLLISVLPAIAQKPLLLILGTPHLNNPGRDMANVTVDDVSTPHRQREIEQFVNRLSRFRPTRIALECTPAEQTEYDRRYRLYRSGGYDLSRDERDQIGLRLAAKLDLARVDCVDYQDAAPGPQEDYDFLTFAQNHPDLTETLSDMATLQKQMVSETSTYMRTHSLTNWYRQLNGQSHRTAEDALYMRYIAECGDASKETGANWIGAWHTRNVVIVENLRRTLISKDRALVLFGSGHGYLLDHFAKESGRFDVVNTESFLR